MQSGLIKLDFFVSLTPFEDHMSWDQLADISKQSIIDLHFWFIQNKEFYIDVKYWELIHDAKNDSQFVEGYVKIKEYWVRNKEKLIAWMENRMTLVEQLGQKYGIPYGNTEGWGTINWGDYPELDWDFIKETGEICAKLAVKYGYRFICTSNFTHPQFKGIWDDVEWHRKVTSIIKGA